MANVPNFDKPAWQMLKAEFETAKEFLMGQLEAIELRVRETHTPSVAITELLIAANAEEKALEAVRERISNLKLQMKLAEKVCKPEFIQQIKDELAEASTAETEQSAKYQSANLAYRKASDTWTAYEQRVQAEQSIFLLRTYPQLRREWYSFNMWNGIRLDFEADDFHFNEVYKKRGEAPDAVLYEWGLKQPPAPTNERVSTSWQIPINVTFGTRMLILGETEFNATQLTLVTEDKRLDVELSEIELDELLAKLQERKGTLTSAQPPQIVYAQNIEDSYYD